MILESISEETLKQLLSDSRTTSRAMLSRSVSRSSTSEENGVYTTPDYRSSSRLSESGQERILSASRMSDRNSPQMPYSISERQPERKPFLPEIDLRGSLSTQRQGGIRLNNEDSTARRPPSAGRLSAVTVRNTFTPTTHTPVLQSYDSEDPAPRPPSGGRRSCSGGKNRTVSPFKHPYDH